MLLAALTSLRTHVTSATLASPHFCLRKSVKILQQGIAQCPNSICLKLTRLHVESRLSEDYNPYKYFSVRPNNNVTEAAANSSQCTQALPGRGLYVLGHVLHTISPWSVPFPGLGVGTSRIREAALGRRKPPALSLRRALSSTTAKVLRRLSTFWRLIFRIPGLTQRTLSGRQRHPVYRLRHTFRAIQSLPPKRLLQRFINEHFYVASEPRPVSRDKEDAIFDAGLFKRFALDQALWAHETKPHTTTLRGDFQSSLQNALPASGCDQTSVTPHGSVSELDFSSFSQQLGKGRPSQTHDTGPTFNMVYNEDRVSLLSCMFFTAFLLLDLGQVILAKEVVCCLRYVCSCLHTGNVKEPQADYRILSDTTKPFTVGIEATACVKIAAVCVSFAEMLQTGRAAADNTEGLARIREQVLDALMWAPFSVKLLQIDSCLLLMLRDTSAAHYTIQRAAQLDAHNVLTQRLLAESSAALYLHREALLHAGMALSLGRESQYTIPFDWLPFYYP